MTNGQWLALGLQALSTIIILLGFALRLESRLTKLESNFHSTEEELDRRFDEWRERLQECQRLETHQVERLQKDINKHEERLRSLEVEEGGSG